MVTQNGVQFGLRLTYNIPKDKTTCADPLCYVGCNPKLHLGQTKPWHRVNI